VPVFTNEPHPNLSDPSALVERSSYNSFVHHKRPALPLVMTTSHKIHRADYAVVGSGVADYAQPSKLSESGSVLVLAKSI